MYSLLVTAHAEGAVRKWLEDASKKAMIITNILIA